VLAIKDLKFINSRMAVKESKLFKISFVNAYTPMKVKSDEEWEEFY